MHRVSWFGILIVAIMAVQLFYSVLSSETAGAQSWLDLSLNPRGDLLRVALPKGTPPQDAQGRLKQWIIEQGGTEPTVSQDQGRLVVHTRWAEYQGGDATIRLDLTHLADYDRALSGVRLSVPRFTQARSLNLDGAMVSRTQTLLGAEFRIIPTPSAEKSVAQLSMSVPWYPVWLLLWMTLFAAGMSYVVSAIIRIRLVSLGESVHYLGQFVPGLFVAFLLLSGYIPYLVYKLGLGLGFLLPILLSGLVILAGATSVLKGRLNEVRFQFASLLALQVLPMIAFLFLRVGLLASLDTGAGTWLNNSVVDWLLDPVLLFLLMLLIGELSPRLLGAHRPTDPVLEQWLPLPKPVNPHRLWIVSVGPQGIANAMTVGWIPSMSNILVTDRLIQELTVAETRAVIAHEAGHVEKAHLFKLASWFFVVYYLVRVANGQVGRLLPGLRPEYLTILTSLCSAGVFLLTSRWMARRFEFEADSRAAHALGPGVDALWGALDKLQIVNGSRVNFLTRLFGTHPPVSVRKEAIRKGGVNP